jgi:hypothetical protein
MSYTISSSTQRFASIDAARLQLARDVRALLEAKRLLGKPVTLPNWAIMDEKGEVIEWYSDCANRSP